MIAAMTGGDEKRTDLAVERTMLAWWRTGLASLVVALAVGRVLPELADARATWPQMTLGLAFAGYATCLFVYGGWRGGDGDGGRPPLPAVILAAFGAVLSVATAAVIAAG